MEIIKMVVGAIQENCYIIKYSDDKAAVVDPGDEGETIAAMLEKNGLTLTHILLTHGHFDHIGAAAFLKNKYGAKVCISEKDSVMLSDRVKAGGNIAPFFPFVPVEPDVFLKEGDKLVLGALTLTVMETPGHSEGSLCFMGDGFIFTGDTIFNCSVGRTDLYSGSFSKQALSLKKLRELEGDYRLYCGHGDDTTLENERKFNPYLDL